MMATLNPDASAQTSNSVQMSLPEGVPFLSSLYVYAAGSCNLACRHCWIVPKFQPNGGNGPYVKFEYVEKAIREGKSLGLQSVKLTGGEPMLHPQFRELITLISDAQLSILIETNGTLIDESIAQFLQNKAPSCFISISLDGAVAETHDALRSVEGSYEGALSGITNLVNAGFHPQVICTLHKGNVAEMDELVALANRLGCGSVKFNHIQQVGRGEKFINEQGLTVPEILQLFKRVETEIVPQSRINVYFDIPMAFYGIGKLLQNSANCAVRNILGLLATGELALCGIGTTVPELIYGHMETDHLQDVWCESTGLARLRERIPDMFEGICGRCIHKNICLGECIANNFHVSGRLEAAYFMCEQADELGFFPSSRKL
jgi:SynChlorMet cassette radical SAM/SPASM protein ScmF